MSPSLGFISHKFEGLSYNNPLIERHETICEFKQNLPSLLVHPCVYFQNG